MKFPPNFPKIFKNSDRHIFKHSLTVKEHLSLPPFLNVPQLVRPTVHLSQNKQNRRKMKRVCRGILCHFFRISRPFFHFSHFAPGSAFARKLKGFRGLFFRSVNKTQNLPKMRKVYSECFAFCGVSRKHLRNSCEM